MVEFKEIEIEGAAYSNWLRDYTHKISDKIEKEQKKLGESLMISGVTLHRIKKD